jgi:uncharacterized protein YecE (DUF72 family)
MKSANLYVGTSGWSYSHWAKGRFYPQGLPQGKWLSFYAQHFATVELNASFYRLPRAEMFAKWLDETPSRFRMAVKLWRRVTHQKKLLDSRADLETFFGVVDFDASRRGPLLVQLPPSMGCDLDRLDTFLEDLHDASGRARWKVAVEFRNTEWLTDETYALLNRHRVALCLADMERCPITEPNDAGFVYVRRHGPHGGYRGSYSTTEIHQDATRVRGWLDEGKTVFVYYNNDVGGHAVDNAQALADAVEE